MLGLVLGLMLGLCYLYVRSWKGQNPWKPFCIGTFAKTDVRSCNKCHLFSDTWHLFSDTWHLLVNNWLVSDAGCALPVGGDYSH